MSAPVSLSATGVLAVAGLGLAAYLIWKGSQVAGAAAEAAKDAAWAITPWNEGNVVYGGVNAIGGAVVDEQGNGRNADGSWSLGGWLHDVFNPDTAQAVRDVTR